MIAPAFMYIDQLRRSWKRVLVLIVGFALTSAITMPLNSGSTFPARIVHHLIISFCIGSLFWLGAPVLAVSTDQLRPTSRWAIRITAAAVTMNVGIIIGFAALAVLKVFTWTFYWTAVLEAMVPATMIGILCFVGFTMYESL